MKKLLAILLVAALTLSLAACGGEKTVSVEDMVSTAVTDVTLMQIQEDIKSNSVKALADYVGKTYLLTGFTYDITNDGCMVSCDYWSEYSGANISITMPKEDLVQLENYGRIEFVGTFSESETGKLTMKNARLVDTVTVLDVTVATSKNTGKWSIFDTQYPLNSTAYVYIDSYATPEDEEKLSHSITTKKIRGKIRLDTENTKWQYKPRRIENAEYVSDEDDAPEES